MYGMDQILSVIADNPYLLKNLMFNFFALSNIITLYFSGYMTG